MLFQIVFKSIFRRPPEAGRKKRTIIGETKNIQTIPTRTFCKYSKNLSKLKSRSGNDIYLAPSPESTTQKYEKFSGLSKYQPECHLDINIVGNKVTAYKFETMNTAVYLLQYISRRATPGV